MYAIILLDGAVYTTAHVFERDDLWAWLHNDVDEAPAGIDGGSLTPGSYQNDKAHAIAVAADRGSDVHNMALPSVSALRDVDDEELDEVIEALAIDDVRAWAEQHGETIPDDRIYVGLWY